MKQLLPTVVLAALAWAQPPADTAGWTKPATTHRLAEFPKVHADGRVWFQFKAPGAKLVQVRIIATDKVYDMQKDKDGVWNAVITPPGVGFQYHMFIVDGLEVTDPGSEPYYSNGIKTGYEGIASGEDYYAIKPVPHGQVRQYWFFSKVTQTFRRMYIYTPPDYDANLKARYPVLYLQHGAGEDEAEWTHAGLANFILDNLIAEKKAVPMMIVMNNGFASRPGETQARGPGGARNFSAFEQMLIEEVIPEIDAKFRTIADRDHRAMAGLSMGGMQTFQIGLTHLDVFSHLGMFSGAPLGASKPLDDILAQGAALNKRLHLFWFGAGTNEERFISRQRELRGLFEKAGIKAVYYESQGTVHEFQTWRRCLNQFAPLLFRTGR
ncbi:MAG: alpha/beta hydrolase-fold protein [Bryobacteraceae bacterium]